MSYLKRKAVGQIVKAVGSYYSTFSDSSSKYQIFKLGKKKSINTKIFYYSNVNITPFPYSYPLLPLNFVF